ncbi:MAG: sulfatase-like hydrolase/transferase [Deltaproteobacteria bacterium]|nr:sulfatase-like hydrolase/transferase [Deltaproteobacteria bacterium]
MVGAYGGDEFDTPHLDRFAARSLRFDRHYSGSLPCMPARHDILCGALDFLWRPWGSIELWEDSITHYLRMDGVKTMLCSDHPHLFETGGENYHTDFHAWAYLRGHEGDPWKMVDDPSWVGAPALPARPAARHRPYDNSRTWFKREEDFPGPKTMSTAVDWLQTNAGQHDRFMLFIDEFDPHEPFDTPEPWASRYDPDWEGPRMIWPPYATRVLEDGVLTEDEARHVRANYGGKLSMIDHWFGKLLDAVDDQDLWKDTAIIVCTDHGHYLGEHDAFGKPGLPIYNTMGHIPLMIAWPGLAPGVTDALSTNVDIFATLTDVFEVEPGHRTHGRSLVPVIEGRADSVREWLLSGIYGRHVHVIDRERKYVRARVERENLPLSMWSNRWSTMPVHATPQMRLPKPDRRATLDFMPGSDVPVIRQRFEPGDMLPYWAYGGPVGDHRLFDVDGDPGEENNRAGSPDEKRAIDLLRAAIEEIEAPREQFERLGIA